MGEAKRKAALEIDWVVGEHKRLLLSYEPTKRGAITKYLNRNIGVSRDSIVLGVDSQAIDTDARLSPIPMKFKLMVLILLSEHAELLQDVTLKQVLVDDHGGTLLTALPEGVVDFSSARACFDQLPADEQAMMNNVFATRNSLAELEKRRMRRQRYKEAHPGNTFLFVGEIPEEEMEVALNDAMSTASSTGAPLVVVNEETTF